MIQVQIEQWERLKAKLAEFEVEIKLLKQENQLLRRKKQKKKTVNFQQNVSVICEINCDAQSNKQNPEYEQKVILSAHNQFFVQNIIKKSENFYNESENLNLVKRICIFGPNLNNLNDITFKNDQRQYLLANIFYPSNDIVYEKYGNYIHPQMIRIKPIPVDKQQFQAQKILYHKLKNQSQKVFIFQCLQTDTLKFTQLSQKINPSKFLHGISINFKDFIIEQQSLHGKKHKSLKSIDLKGTLLNLNTEDLLKEQIKLQTASLHDIEFRNQPFRMYLTCFSLVIFSYFPFIDFFQSIISNLFEQARLKRIQTFMQGKSLKYVDAFFFMQQLQEQILKINQLLIKPLQEIGPQLSLKINHNSIHLCLNGSMIIQEIYKGWVNRILKLLNKDILYQLYCLVMLEQSIYFVCEDSQILTLIILLFSSIFTRPFSYPYPVISIIFNNELLHTPFTSIVGINQSIKWLEKPEILRIIDLNNRTVVLMTQKQIKIKGNQRFFLLKQSVLYDIFAKFYKKSKSITFSLKDLLSKKQMIRSSQNAQKDNSNVLSLFCSLDQYFDKNIFCYLPSKSFIEKRACQLQIKQKNPCGINIILDEILSEYKIKNPDFVLDGFLSSFVQCEIFSIFLSEFYKLR